ncbi:hypothetical protein [Haloglycomyces albus]|uniref:hypothetical protein n=1 Tax=Haloglycomyces albus TaxID=526067 RepID=UPI0009FDBF01|nr:hypothetical protein [Haloglycomyces albus]
MASLLVLLALIALVTLLRIILTPTGSWGGNPYRALGHHVRHFRRKRWFNHPDRERETADD